MSGLELQHIFKRFGEKVALADVSFSVERSEIVGVIGPSGSGKSTLLGIIAGLVEPDRGDVFWEGESLRGTPPYRRGFGLMFQDFALFPHRDVFQNVAFGLQMAHWPADKIQTRVTEVLELVGLPGFGSRDVNTLSGGEQQRVALARSLAPNPRLLMLDEPLGSLDRNLRERLVVDLRAILRRTRQTAVYVTHDQEEAFTLAQRVVLMNAGRVEQIDTPQGMYRYPATAFVARFLGLNNLLPGRLRPDQAGGTIVETEIGNFPSPEAGQGPVTVLLRPDMVHLNRTGKCVLEGEVEETTFRGGACRARIEVNGVTLIFDFLSNVDLPPVGASVQLSFNPEEGIQIFRE